MPVLDPFLSLPLQDNISTAKLHFMKILVSNDDGIDAPGIKMLARSLSALGDIFVVAPDRNRSGASNSLTLTRPLYIHERQENWTSVQGTPTDCVHLAVTGLMANDPPHIFFS